MNGGGGPSAATPEPPEALRRIAERLESRGHEAWAVGGALRDVLLGRARTDWDLATSARPEEVRALFPRTVPLGIEHGTVGVLGADEALYEVTTFRRDVETDGRHAVVEFADRIEEDLARRDFTINAIAWRPATEEWKDPFGGADDLQEGVLRAVGIPGERFAEDYLRVLRGLRFAGRYRLEIDPPTRRALEEAVSGLADLSAERVREELVKVLEAPEPSASLALYAETGALRPWHRELARAAEEDPRWEEVLGTVDRLRPHRPLLRLTALLVPVAWPAGADRGDEPELERTRELLERLRFSNAEVRRVGELLERYLPLVQPLDSAAGLREWLARVGPADARDLFRLHFAAARARGAEQSLRALLHTWRRVHEELLAGHPLTLSDLAVDGNDILELGVPRGPLVGLLLEELHAQVLEDPEANRRGLLLERARELVELGGLGAADDG